MEFSQGSPFFLAYIPESKRNRISLHCNQYIISIMQMIKIEDVQDKVLQLRNENVIIDSDVATLYGVETKRINEG